ncbi:four and a half LIM domains protein 2-like [Lampetra fluviatilis]
MSERCEHCVTPLAGKEYVLRECKPYCTECFTKLFSFLCVGCGKTIGAGTRKLSLDNLHWHEGCFKCSECATPIGAATEYLLEGKEIVCKSCAISPTGGMGDSCVSCKRGIREGVAKVAYKGRTWHERCFACARCMETIGTKSFVPHGDEIYCVSCNEKKTATRCFTCHKPVTEKGVVYKEHTYHRDCLVCIGCNTPLAGLNMCTRGELLYCEPCFEKKYSKKCTNCRQPITAGAKFLTHDSLEWHTECFKCKRCGLNMAGKGFVARGDDIFCGDCAK